MTLLHGILCPESLDILHEPAHIGIGHGDQFGIHDRLGKTALHEHVTDIMHVMKGRDMGPVVDFRPCLAQLHKRIRTEGREHQQSAGPQDPAHVTQGFLEIRTPLQCRIGIDQVDRSRRERQLLEIGAERDGTTHEPPPLACLVEHRQRKVERDHPRLRVTLHQCGRRLSGAGAGIENRARLQPDVVKTVEHAAGNFALQDCGLVVARGRP